MNEMNEIVETAEQAQAWPLVLGVLILVGFLVWWFNRTRKGPTGRATKPGSGGQRQK